ncbi:hypothetical protein [Pseudorhodoplanes sp.]|uniref:hypothetical protein n=1 Tax=Pseudorhodoplanes sp. TaxID=1934341 RepID=UPI002BE58D95|nr:hypothetical protein [Pseudorhodoplanes sp.]HWV55431.1 hypothetical protein [Pseudorhodoplanes sp.]
MSRVAGRRSSRKLQDNETLPGGQSMDQQNLSTGEFQRVMMDVGLVFVDLAEASHSFVASCIRQHSERAVVFNRLFECNFRSRE